MSGVLPINLHFENSGEWHSLPKWAEYFISVGKQLKTADHSSSRIVTAIVVPTRAYCAAFVSLGMVVNDAAARDRSSYASHFQKLLGLAHGTPVIFRLKPGKSLKGIMQSSVESGGKTFLRVQVHSGKGGGLTHLIDESRALQVQPAYHSGKLPNKQSAKNKQYANRFVDCLLGDADPVQLGLRSKIVCAIVGKRNSLEHEIKKTPLSLHANGKHHSHAHLQDVLRVDSFTSGSQSFRSVIVPTGSGQPSGDVINKVEVGVVFDGAAGFLKWGSLWPDRHQIVILDRTELYFDDAISAINSRYAQNRADEEPTLPASDPPAGGELLAFREAIP